MRTSVQFPFISVPSPSRPFLCYSRLPPLYPLQFLNPLFSLPSSATTRFFSMLVSRYFADSFISYIDVLSTQGVTLSRVPKISDSSIPIKAPYEFVPKTAAWPSITCVLQEVVVWLSNSAENGNGLSWVGEDRRGSKDGQKPVRRRMQHVDFILSAHKRHSYIQQQYHWHGVSRKDSNSWFLCTATLPLSFSVLSPLADLPLHLNQN